MSRWECRSAGLPGPVRGTDRYTFVDGRIARLEVTIDEEPPAGDHPDGPGTSDPVD